MNRNLSFTVFIHMHNCIAGNGTGNAMQMISGNAPLAQVLDNLLANTVITNTTDQCNGVPEAGGSYRRSGSNTAAKFVVVAGKVFCCLTRTDSTV